MTDTQPPSTKGEEISLEDIDKLLEAEDPEFARSLEEVRTVETDSSVTIEASAIDESLAEEAPSDKPEQGLRKYLSRARLRVAGFRSNVRSAFANLGKNTLIFLKTRPKEYGLYSVVLARQLFKSAMVPLSAFANADRSQKLLALVLTGVCVGALWVLFANVKGVWLPQISEPILKSFTEHADWVESYDPKEAGESFYSAFPQERHEFLFRRMKVNLRRTAEHPLPMGAFELIVLLDSKDTAIEVRDREVEFFDLLQRVFEEESFPDLETELGKNKVKARLKRELNQKLTQGWAKDISFKTFVLKP